MPKLVGNMATVLAGAATVASLTGCYGTIARRTEDFSVKAAPALVEARGVYSLVEATHARRKREEAIALYDTTAFDKVKLEARFGSERDLKARTAVIDLLQKYVVALGDESGGKPLSTVDAPSKDAATALTAVAKKDLSMLLESSTPAPSTAATASTTGATAAPPTTTTTTTTTTEANPIVSGAASVGADDATKAIDAIGRVLVERERARALPRILENAEAPVRTLCDLLRRDIGDPQTSGLRYLLRIDYEGIETAEDAAIRDHPADYRYPEKYQAVDALYSLVTEQAAADAVLVQADKALEAFEMTHTALVKSAREKRAAGFQALLAELTAEGEQLAEMEKTMNKAGDQAAGPTAGKASGGGK